ncbi:MAG: hypothetical protein DI528_17455 [Shinella sp.]|nr:MAG: hypothetical protein DI528_17455 [Shinella sp.]
MEARVVDNHQAADRLRILAIFFTQSVVGAMLYMRMPDLQERAGLSSGELGGVLMGGPIGALMTYMVAARMVEALGTRAVIFWTCIVTAFTASFVTLPTGPVLMFIVLMVNGAVSSIANIAINVEADRIEAGTRARIMNRCHGVWSIGYFLSSSIAGVLRGVGFDPVIHLWVLLPIYSVLVAAVVLPMTEYAPRAHTGSLLKRKFVMPTLAVCILVAFGLGAQLLEGASRVWATIYIRDAFDVLPIIQSAAPPALVLTMAAGRLFADGWIDRHGPRNVAALSLVVALCGMLLLVLAPNAYVAIAGFAVAGLGAGVIYPLMLSSAARLGDRPASENVASLTLIIQLVMLVSPMVIGIVAEHFGIRVAFGILIPLLAFGLLVARKIT